MLEWKQHPLDVEARAQGKGRTVPMKWVSGVWTLAKWDMSDPRFALWRGDERFPKQFGFKSAQEAMDLANDMERRGV
jgi:hypothetical protein